MKPQLRHTNVTTRVRPGTDNALSISCVVVIEDADFKPYRPHPDSAPLKSDPSVLAKIPFELSAEKFGDMTVADFLTKVSDTARSVALGYTRARNDEAA